jgi:hypothetical protein
LYVIRLSLMVVKTAASVGGLFHPCRYGRPAPPRPRPIFRRGAISGIGPSGNMRCGMQARKRSSTRAQNRRGPRAFPGMAAWIEPAIPAPRVLVVRAAGADCDHPHVHVPVIDVPALLEDIGIAAAGEGGHGPIKAQARSAGKSSYGLGFQRMGATAARGSLANVRLKLIVVAAQ